MREPVYLRGRIWWCFVRNPNGGRRIRASTGCRDRKAAIEVWRELERESVTPAHRAANKATFGDALDRRVDERRSAGRAQGTLDMYDVKGRHLSRLIGSETPLSRIDAAVVDAYVATRLREGAARNTIYKELVVLRGTLKLARRRGEYARTVEEVMPLDFAANYKPKERRLGFAEIELLLARLPAHRAALVAYLVATGATYPSEVQHARKSDVDRARWTVRLRGTKRETRDRIVPIPSYLRPLLLRSLDYGPPFPRWTNVRRDLHAACDEAQIARCSPNDLRRSFGSLIRAHGVAPHAIGVAMGHRDSRMVERVYGRLDVGDLASLLESAGDQPGHTQRRRPQKQLTKRAM